MPNAVIGREFLFLVDLNTSATSAGEKWVQFSMQKDGGLSFENDLVDTTSKQDSGFSSDVITTKRWSANFSGNYDPFNPGLDLIVRKQQSEHDYKIKVKFREQNGTEIVGFARVESFESSHEVQSVSEFTISLKGQGKYELR